MGAPPGPWASGRFDVEGHRGAKGLVVENTLASFAAAFDAGATGVELDVRLTADGQVVVWHDAVLLPEKCLATGPDVVGARLEELTLEQLRTVDVGSQTLAGYPDQRPSPGARISTLDEVLAHGRERAPDVWWTIELKVDPLHEGESAGRRQLLEGVLAGVHEAGVERQCFVHSFDWTVLELSAQLAPDVARSALVEPSRTWVPGSPFTGSVQVDGSHDDVCAGAAAVGAQVISPQHVLVDAAFVERAHGLGLAVLPWTVNDPERMSELLAAGVDGLVSDYPDRAVALSSPVGS
ncbi:MAG TPA: glycerophosphodiester phosphodiesterase family protein [Terrabacter sp.]|nr:glycerophosphodiester phosphodiesterase family protein [Terrabacter sp.]